MKNNSLKDLLISLVDAGVLQLDTKLFNPRCNNYPTTVQEQIKYNEMYCRKGFYLKGDCIYDGYYNIILAINQNYYY